MIARPCILIVDPDPGSGSISSRKLVLETARFNVIATYSCEEALATLERFPRVNAVLLNAVLEGEECTNFLDEAKVRYPEPVRIIVGILDHPRPAAADMVIDSYSPRVLLEHLLKTFPEHAAPKPAFRDEEPSP